MYKKADADDVRRLFDKFKALYPFNEEPFIQSDENVFRWRWHISEAEQRAAQGRADVWKHTVPESFAQRIESRCVRKWEDFPEKTKSVYRAIASAFPGTDVYACGSRVRGDYTNGKDGPEVKQWRLISGKADKSESDFDFYAPLNAVEIAPLPAGADRVRHGVPDDEKILVPMEQWNFDKLPKSEHARVIELFNAGRWVALAQIHDQYGLSNYSYCCDLSGLKVWYKFGIQSGKIGNGASATNAGV